MAAPRKKKTTVAAAPAEPVAPLAAPVSLAKLRLTGTQVTHLLSAVVAIASIGTALYFRSEYRQVIAERDPSSETREIVEAVGAFLELPTDETPTLATVTDKSKLAADTFFAPAENGDRILVYQTSRKAIIYRPSTKKLVNVATLGDAPAKDAPADPAPVQEPASDAPAADPVSAPAEEVLSEESAADTVSTPVTVALYNGSAKVGVTAATEERLAGSFSDLVVEKKEKAAKKDYPSDIIIDLTGGHTQLIEEVAAVISATVGTLPEGETDPGTDILIIVGNKLAP